MQVNCLSIERINNEYVIITKIAKKLGYVFVTF